MSTQRVRVVATGEVLDVAEPRYQTPASEYVAYRWRTAPDGRGAVALCIGWRRWADVEPVAEEAEV